MPEATKDARSWRDFDRNQVTHSMAHYLTAVHKLRQEFGYARSTDVAEFLDVSRGAASMALAQLKKRGWIAEDPNRFLLLTEEGARIAERVEQNFLILHRFFEEVLGASGEAARSDACKMEHLLGMETGMRLIWLMRHLLDDAKLLKVVREAMQGFEGDAHIDEMLKAAPRPAGQRAKSSGSGARR